MDVRTHILRVSTRRFARQGFDSTSLQEIADEVGVKKPSLLHHFPSKADLLRAVLDNLFDHWTESLPRLLEAVTSGQGRFEALTLELVRFFRDDPDRARLVIRELMDRPEAMRGRFTTTLTPWLTLIGDYIRKSKDAGEVPSDVEPELYIVHVVTLTVSAIAGLPALTSVVPGDREDVGERYIRELLRITRASLFTR